MISNSHGQAAQKTSETGSETVFNGQGPEDTVASTAEKNAKKNQEAEITRLTWAVLDGKASAAERIRLAELVNAQHEQRQA